jgi:hypothetical protein
MSTDPSSSSSPLLSAKQLLLRIAATHIFAHTHVYKHAHIHTHARTRTRMRTHIHTHTCAHARTHAHTHTNTHTNTQSQTHTLTVCIMAGVYTARGISFSAAAFSRAPFKRIISVFSPCTSTTWGGRTCTKHTQCSISRLELDIVCRICVCLFVCVHARMQVYMSSFAREYST